LCRVRAVLLLRAEYLVLLVSAADREPMRNSHAVIDDRLWTQAEAARYLHVSPRYLRASSCPKVLLPGTGARGRALVRYDPARVRAWAAQRETLRRFE